MYSKILERVERDFDHPSKNVEYIERVLLNYKVFVIFEMKNS